MNDKEDESIDILHVDINTDGDAENDDDKGGKEQKAVPAEDAPTLTEVIKEQATEDEAPLSKNFTLKKILGGDIFNTSTIRRQIWLLLLITAFLVVYISNRYSCQQYLIEIDRLSNELQDVKYKALSTSSQLTEKTRESHILELLKTDKDSTLRMAEQPPYIINVPEK